jgi:hypothetical protein
MCDNNGRVTSWWDTRSTSENGKLHLFMEDFNAPQPQPNKYVMYVTVRVVHLKSSLCVIDYFTTNSLLIQHHLTLRWRPWIFKYFTFSVRHDKMYDTHENRQLAHLSLEHVEWWENLPNLNNVCKFDNCANITDTAYPNLYNITEELCQGQSSTCWSSPNTNLSTQTSRERPDTLWLRSTDTVTAERDLTPCDCDRLTLWQTSRERPDTLWLRSTDTVSVTDKQRETWHPVTAIDWHCDRQAERDLTPCDCDRLTLWQSWQWV